MEEEKPKKSVKKVQEFKLWQIGILGLIVFPFVVVLLVFIVSLMPFVTIYLVCSKVIDLRADKHDKNLKIQYKIKTNANTCNLELALKKLENGTKR